jgi:hypothetical protein
VSFKTYKAKDAAINSYVDTIKGLKRTIKHHKRTIKWMQGQDVEENYPGEAEELDALKRRAASECG